MLVTRFHRAETRKMTALTAVIALVKEYTIPEKKAFRSMGKKKNREMLFWTKEEYLKFAEVE